MCRAIRGACCAAPRGALASGPSTSVVSRLMGWFDGGNSIAQHHLVWPQFSNWSCKYPRHVKTTSRPMLETNPRYFWAQKMGAELGGPKNQCCGANHFVGLAGWAHPTDASNCIFARVPLWPLLTRSEVGRAGGSARSSTAGGSLPSAVAAKQCRWSSERLVWCQDE